MRFVPIEQEDAPQLTFVPIESAEPPVPQKTGGRAWGDTAGDAWQSLRSGIGSVVNMAGTAADDPLAFFGATGTAIADTLATGPVRAASTLKEWATGDGSLPLDMDKGARELHGGFSPAYEKYGSDLASSRKAADESGSVSSVLRGVGGLIQEQSKEKMSASSKARDARYEKTKGFEALSFLKDEPGKIIDMIAENIPQQLPMLGLGRGAGIIANRAAVREAQIAGAGAFEYATTQPGVRAALEAGSQGMDNWVKSSVEKAAKEAAEKAMERFSPYMTAINVGSESLSTVAQTVDAIHKGVANAKLEDLMQIPMYRDFLAQSNGNDSDARRLLAARLSAEWAPVSGIGTAFGSLVTGGAKAQAQALAGQVTGFKLASKNTGKEALEEMVQNPLEDAGMFWAKKQYDPTAELDPVKSAIEGAVVSVGHSGPLQFAKPIADSVKRSPEEQIARDIDYGVKNTSYDSSLVDAEARNKLSANQGLDPTLYAKPRIDPSTITAPEVDSVDKAVQAAQAVVASTPVTVQAPTLAEVEQRLNESRQRQVDAGRVIPNAADGTSQNASQPNQPQALADTDVAATNTVAPAAPTNPIARTSDAELLSRVPEIGEMQASTTMPQFSYTVQPNGAVMIHGDTASIKEAFPGERTYSVKGGVLVGASRAADVVSALGGDYETATVRNSDAGTSQGSGNAADTNAGAIPEMARREGQAIPQSVQQADSDASRAAGQKTLDYFHSKDPATHPKVVLGRPDAKADAQIQSAMQQAKELFGTTANVVAFSDPSPDSVNGIQIGKTVYINTKGLTSNALNTGWHETHHVMQAQAEADTREGKINTTAQRYISKVDAIFDSMSEAGKRSYIENFLYKDRLAGLSRQEREAAVQSALTSAETRKEMMADFVGNRATDREFIKSLAKADPKNFQQWAKKWLQTITDLIADLRGKKSSKSESDAVDKYVRDLNKAKMILRDAMVELRREGVISQSDNAGFDGYLADTGANQNFAVLVGKHDIPMYKRRESYDSIDDINDLGNFNLDDIGVSESDDEKLFKKFDPDAIDAGELAAKIEAELMEKMYGTTTGKVADSGALKTSDFGATLDRSIKQAGLHPENAFPDLEYKTNSDGSRTAAFRVNGVRYISEIKDGKSPSMRGPSGLDADPGDSNANGNLGGHAISHDFRGLTQEAKEAWNKRMAANGELLRRGYDIYTAVPKDARQRVADVWKSIAQNPDAFEFMKAESPTGKNYKEVALDIAKKMLGSGRYEARLGELDDSENMTHSGGFALFIKDKKTGIESRATVDYNRLEKRVVMHTHNLEKGSGAGKAVYQVGQAFATAFNAKIKADHVLLGVNNYRRTEQMFSGMLRSGNYDTMQPGIGQRIFGWNERAKTADQQERNMVRTALAITRNVEELAPDISKISYDLQSGRFYMKDRGDTTESRLMAGIIVKRILADTDVRAMSVSRSTLARAAVTLDAIEGNVEVPDHIHEPVLYSRKQRKLDERTDVAPMMDELGRALKSKTSASIDRAMGRISDWRKMLNSVNEASFQSELMGIGERAVSLAVRSGVTEQDARTVPVPTGATPHVLRMLGFDMNPMTASSRIIGKILNGKHAKDFANATPKEFIESIYHPILITNLQKPDEYEIVSNIIHPQDGSPESGFPVVFVVKRNAVFEGQVGENGKRMKSLATHSLMSAYAKPSFWTIGLRSGMKTGKLLYANVGALQELESKNPALGRVLLPRGASTNPDTQTVNPVSADSASLPSTSDDGSLRKERANVSIGSAPSGLVAPSASQLTKDIAKSVMAGSVKGYGDLVKWVSENYTGDGDEMPLYSRKHYDSQAALDAKFERMRRFHQDFDDLRQRIHDDAENGKEEAAILRLIARTGFRIGGDPSLSGNHEAFGASTLKPDHVTIDGDEIHFDFIGKAGVRQQHSIEDPVLAKDLAARLENEKLFSKADRAVRKYLDSIIDGKDYKVHDFRTWNATRAAMDVVNDLPLPVNAEEFRAAMELAGSVAASKIGDTLGVTLEHYVDPQIFDEWRESAGVKNPPRVPSSTGQSESQSTEADDAGAGEGDNGQAVQVDLSRKQTDTPEFKKWFGDSKVVDADGKPLVLYHGTKGDFTKFGKTRTGVGSTMFGTYEVERHGIFVTPSAELANDFATQGERNKQTGANVMPLYASIQNPLDMTQGYTDSIFNAVEKWGDAKDLNGYRIARNLGDNWGDWMLFDEDTGQDPGFLINMLKELGYDGVKFYEPKVAGEGASGDTFVAFDPEQIKSAIGNNGDFDGTNPDIRYKRKAIVGHTNRQYTPEQLKAFDNVGFQVEVPTLAERSKELWKDAVKKLTQGIADQFVPIAEFDKKAYGLMRLSKGASGAFEALLQGGKLKLTDKVYDFDADNRGGVVETLLTPLQGEHHDFLRWIAANRAERLSAEDRENLFSAEDIVAIKSLASGQTDFDYTLKHGPNAGSVTRNRSEIYNDSLKTFDAFNRNVMDMAEQSGLIDPEARAVWEHEFYVPFYRQTDEDGFVGARVKAGVVRQKAFKELKGGKDKLNADLLDNTLMNWAHLLDASAKNRAAAATLEAAEDLGIAIEAPESTLRNMSKSIGNKNGVVWVMDEGKQRFFLVDDPYVLAALNGLEYAGMKGPIMDVMSSFKHALTIGVTASPFFKVRNLIRDSVQAISVGNLSYNPVKNVVQGFKLSNRVSDDHFRLLASGGTIHFGTMYEGSEARRVQALVESGVDQGSILDSQHKVKAFYRKFIEPGITAYNELGNRGEEINRASLYDQLRKQGVSHADAALQARDLMDFSMQGSFQTVRFLTQVVPFMNARIQGLYKLGRGAKENPARFSAVLGMVALASLGLLAAYHDDDDWKQREEWDRNNFWWFKFGGNAFRIPKPFEVGAIGTLAERGFEWMFDKEMTNKRFMSQVGTLLSDNLSMNPIPQAAKPILDVYSNKDRFSGRDIQSASMEKLEPQERYNAGTSMAARGASTAMSKVMGTSALSPVQIDHLLRGYFGWLGSFVVGAGDVIARPATNQPKRPTPDYWKVATGGMVADKDSGSSRYVSQMYEQAKELEMAYSTFRAIEKKGNAEATREYVKDNLDKLQRYDQVEAAKKSLSLMNERIRMIERSSMEHDKKRDMIRDLKDEEDRIARSLVPH